MTSAIACYNIFCKIKFNYTKSIFVVPAVFHPTISSDTTLTKVLYIYMQLHSLFTSWQLTSICLQIPTNPYIQCSFKVNRGLSIDMKQKIHDGRNGANQDICRHMCFIFIKVFNTFSSLFPHILFAFQFNRFLGWREIWTKLHHSCT